MFKTNSSLLWLVSLRLEIAIFEKSTYKNLHYFRKTLYRRCLRGFWSCLRPWIYQGSEYGSGSEYARVLYLTGFWICHGFEYARLLNMSLFCIYQSSELARVLNIPEFWIYQCYGITQASEYASISLNNSQICFLIF